MITTTKNTTIVRALETNDASTTERAPIISSLALSTAAGVARNSTPSHDPAATTEAAADARGDDEATTTITKIAGRRKFSRLHRHKPTDTTATSAAESTAPADGDAEQMTLEGGSDGGGDEEEEGANMSLSASSTPTPMSNSGGSGGGGSGGGGSGGGGSGGGGSGSSGSGGGSGGGGKLASTQKGGEDGEEPAAKSTETEVQRLLAVGRKHLHTLTDRDRAITRADKAKIQGGICESIRLIFRFANQTFIDERISKKKWLAIKDSTFYGKIPILEVDGKQLAQCYAISRYLAKQFNLIGADSWEAAKLDEVADFHKGVHNEISPYIFVLSGYRRGDRDALRRDLFVPAVEKNFPIYVNLLKASSSGFFGKSGVSWIDFVVAEYMSTIKFYEPSIIEKYPLITALITKVQTLPQLKDYIKNRVHTPLHFCY